jgi:hypothetical protein
MKSNYQDNSDDQDQIDSDLKFDDLMAIQIIGEDELFLREDHWLKYDKIVKHGDYKPELLMPFFAKDPSQIYTNSQKIFFKTDNHVDEDLLQDLDEQYLSLKISLSSRKINWVNTKSFEIKLEKLSKDLNLSPTENEEIKRALFNYYISSCFEKYFKKLKLPHALVNIFKERISQADEISLKINAIIDDNSYDQSLSHLNYVQIDKALKNARTLIRKQLLGYNNKANGYDLDEFEKQAITIKNSLYTLSFKKGQPENISANRLILILYKIFTSESSVFVPKIEITIKWLNSSFDLDSYWKIQKFNSNSLRKRIKDLEKREDYVTEDYIKKISTLTSYYNRTS